MSTMHKRTPLVRMPKALQFKEKNIADWIGT